MDQVEIDTIARNIRDNIEDIEIYKGRTLYYHQGFSVRIERLNADNIRIGASGISNDDFKPILDAIPTVDR
jgi:hypothetical protein